jgi:hypothetical protein
MNRAWVEHFGGTLPRGKNPSLTLPARESIPDPRY